MYFLKVLGKILYIAIFFIIIIYGIIGLSNLLDKFNIVGSMNSTLTFILVLYALGMFFYDIEKNDSKNKEK